MDRGESSSPEIMVEPRRRAHPEETLTEAARVRYSRKLIINGAGIAGVIGSVAVGTAGYFLSVPELISGSAMAAIGSMLTTAVAELASDHLPPRG
ncbi:MAG: hypothetical protein SGJ18_03290 [Pseudomonadota bacterium]|nr:hypothetical protein [Pseudomonadota bacterium]